MQQINQATLGTIFDERLSKSKILARHTRDHNLRHSQRMSQFQNQFNDIRKDQRR